MLGLRCALPLAFMSIFVCQAAEKGEAIILDADHCLTTGETRVHVQKQDIEVYKPVVMSGHPYALYRCKTYANNACQEGFKAFRLDGFFDESIPLTKDISAEDFLGADKIIGIVHKAKERYVLRAQAPMLVLAQHVQKSCGTSSCQYYKAVFFGGAKTRDGNARALFEFMQQLYRGHAIQNSPRQEGKD